MSRTLISIGSELKAWQLVLLLLLVGFASASTVPAVTLPVLLQEQDEDDDEDEDDYDEDDDDDDDETPAPIPQPPKQIVQSGALEGETRFRSFDEPPFFQMQIPKKPKGLRDDWVFIDKDERLEAKLEDVNREIEIEDEKEGTEGHDERKQALRDRKTKIEVQYKNVRLIAEKWVGRGSVQFVQVVVDRASKDQKIHLVNRKKTITEKWKWTNVVPIEDRDLTTKRERQANRFSWLYEATGTPPKNAPKHWGRWVTYLVYNKKKTTRYIVHYQHIALASEFEADEKAFMKVANALLSKFKLL